MNAKWHTVEHEPVWAPTQLRTNAEGDTKPGYVCTHELENGNGPCGGNVFRIEDVIGTHACVVEGSPARRIGRGRVTPIEAAMDAYSDAVRVEFGVAPSQDARERDRAVLNVTPGIRAMLDAHERAVLLAAGQKLRDWVDEKYTDPTGATGTRRRAILAAARLIEPEPTEDEIREGVAGLLRGMAARRDGDDRG